MHRSRKRCYEILVFALALFFLAASTYRCFDLLAETEANAASSDSATAMTVGSDMRLYISAAQKFQVTGQLYERASYFGPIAPLFKFPPAFQLQFIPLQKIQNTETVVKFTRWTMIAAYFLACLGLARRIELLLQEKKQPSIRIIIFYISAGIAATSNYGLQDAVRITNYEIIIFSLLIASCLLFDKHPRLSAVIIAFLGSAKFYPAFMASFLLTKWNKKDFFTLLISTAAFFLLGLVCFGMQENLFYWLTIFPMLLSEEMAPIMYNMSFGGGLFIISQNIEFSKIAFQVYRIVFLILTFALLIRNHGNKNKNTIDTFALLMTLMLICLPNYWQTYLIMLFPAFCSTASSIVIRPTAATITAFLICMMSVAFDNHSWLDIAAPTWLSGNAPPDELGRKVIETASEQSFASALLILAYHYPWTVILYLLEKIKFLVPGILWLMLARQIMSTSLPHQGIQQSTHFIKS